MVSGEVGETGGVLRVWPRLQIGWAGVFSLFGPRTWATLLMGWCRPAFSPRMQDHNWAGEDLFGPVLKLKMSFLYPTDPLKGGMGHVCASASTNRWLT